MSEDPMKVGEPFLLATLFVFQGRSIGSRRFEFVRLRATVREIFGQTPTGAASIHE
jgi:hypothetical protein